MMRRLVCVCAVVVGVGPGTGIDAEQNADWTQFGGPNRNFQIEAPGLAATWPGEGPRRLWTREIGEGFSAVAAAGDTLYTMSQRGEEEVVIAMDRATGSTRWEHAYVAPITDKMSRAPGPRATPLILDGVVFTSGATGKIHALNASTGKPLWAHDLYTEFKGHVQDEYYAASPLAYKHTVIIPAGGPGASVIAFNRATGDVVWQAQDFKLSYASPVLITVDGQTQLAVVTEGHIIGLHPDSGALLWSHPHGNVTRTNVSTPVWGPGNLLFVSSAYDSGSRVLELKRTGDQTTVTELWYHRQLRIHTANAIRRGDIIYGTSGDFTQFAFVALNVRTGAVLWQDRGFLKASIIDASGRFIMLNEDGELLLATPSESGLTIHSRIPLLTKTAWTPPTLAGTTLYARDRKTLVALDLR